AARRAYRIAASWSPRSRKKAAISSSVDGLLDRPASSSTARRASRRLPSATRWYAHRTTGSSSTTRSLNRTGPPRVDPRSGERLHADDAAHAVDPVGGVVVEPDAAGGQVPEPVLAGRERDRDAARPVPAGYELVAPGRPVVERTDDADRALRPS